MELTGGTLVTGEPGSKFMTYKSQWERLSTAAERLATERSISQAEARGDICRAVSDGAVKVRAKLLRHTTKGMRSREPVLSGVHFRAPKISPNEIDWATSAALKAWWMENHRVP